MEQHPILRYRLPDHWQLSHQMSNFNNIPLDVPVFDKRISVLLHYIINVNEFRVLRKCYSYVA